MKFLTDNWLLCARAGVALYLWHRGRASATAPLVAGTYGSASRASGEAPPYAAHAGYHWERTPHVALDDSGRQYDWKIVADAGAPGAALPDLGLSMW